MVARIKQFLGVVQIAKEYSFELTLTSRHQEIFVVIFAISFIVSLSYGIAASSFNLNEYGDGSFFSFAILTDNSWDLIWCNYSGRLTAYLLTIFPAQEFLRITGNANISLRLYAFLFYSMPMISHIVIFFTVPKHSRSYLLFPAAFFLAVGVLDYGYPTEVWIMSSFFWPLLYSIIFRARSKSSVFLSLILSLGYVFSHESMILDMPIIVMITFRKNKHDNANALMIWPVIMLPLLMWALVKLIFPPPSDMIAEHLRQNAIAFFFPNNFRNVIFLKSSLVFIILMIFFVARGINAKAMRFTVAAALILVLAWVICYKITTIIYAVDRYRARSIVVAGLMIVGLLASISKIKIVDGGSNQHSFYLNSLVNAAMFAVAFAFLFNLSTNIKFISLWSTYRQELRTLIDNAVLENGNTSIYLREVRVSDDFKRVSWNWALPFSSVLVADSMAPRAILIDDSYDFKPVTCHQSKKFFNPLVWHSPSEYEPLVSYLCDEKSLSAGATLAKRMRD